MDERNYTPTHKDPQRLEGSPAGREYIHPKRQQRQRTGNRVEAAQGKNGTKMNRKKKRITLKKVLIIAASVLTALFLIFNLLLFYFTGKVSIVETGKRDTSIKPTMESDDVKNILIIGSDTRDLEAAGRTDAMIILSINKKKKEIVMTSLMRDMYLPLVGYASDGTKMYNDDEPDGLYRNKLNSAYVFGGAELLMDSIQYNFGLKIDEYFYIDFSTFINIIDAVGGITLDVTKEEVKVMNSSIRGQNRALGKPVMQDQINSSGSLLLNGNQALSYARLRQVGNADFQRTQRQRLVINKVLDKVKDSGMIKKFEFLKVLMSNLTTNMSRSDLFFYGYKAPFYLGYTIKELRIPGDKDYEFGTHSGQSTLDIDLEKCREAMRKEIFS